MALRISAIAVVAPDGTVLNTVAHDDSTFSEGAVPPAGWPSDAFPQGTLYVPVYNTPPPEPVEVGAVYDEVTGTFSSVD